MDTDDVVRICRAHLEAQFPKACPQCGRSYGSLREYLQSTKHVGSPVSYDVNGGSWRPLKPVGTVSFANCRCGTTLSISSTGMPLLTLWRLMAWGRQEITKRGIRVEQLLEEIRGLIDAQVLREPSEQLRVKSALERMAEWRASVVMLYTNGIVLSTPPILALWMLVRAEPALSPPAPGLLGLLALWLGVRFVVPQRFRVGVAAVMVALTGVLSQPLVGPTPGAALVQLTAAVLVTINYRLRWGVLIAVVSSIEYVVCAAMGWYPASSLTRAADVPTALRMAGFYAFSAILLLVALARLFERLERAWFEQDQAAQRERAAQEELRRTELAAREAERLEALGRLAGSVAHDFNNLLMIILSWADLVSASDNDPVIRAEGVGHVRKAATQAATLTRRLLTFARKDAWSPTELDVDAAVASIVESLRRLVPHGVQVLHERAPMPKVTLDETALGQILVNLTVNAGDAMPDGGQLRIKASLLPASAQPPEAVDPTADHVVLRVSDTGTGMDAVTMARAFEPFFTTKAVGKGTGLGLASVYGIVQRAGGWIRVESTLGSGTEFSLGFPIAATRTSAPPVASTSVGQTGHVLVAEDDEQIRSLIATTLRSAGHEVTLAGNATDAILAVRRFSGDIHVLCTDAVMPGEPTRALVDAFRERFPHGGVIVCSGHGRHELDKRGLTADVGDYLPKPFDGAELLSLVARHVQAAKSRTAPH